MIVDDPISWVVLGVAALTVGLAKTALPGIGILPVVLFAAVLPARLSTGVLLVLLIVADVFAVLMYRSHVDWRALRRLVPTVATGLAIGAIVLAFVDDVVLTLIIGLLLAGLSIVSLAKWRSPFATGDLPQTDLSSVGAGPSRLRSWIYGPIAGAMTMVANAAGPVMTIYFIASGLSVRALLGTLGWFYFVINASKLPFSIAIGLITPQGLLIDLFLLPALVAGALLGLAIARRINRAIFELIIYLVTLASSIYLIVSVFTG